MSKSQSYATELALDAPIDRVFAALTTVEGLRAWWGTDATVSEELGGEIRLRWSSMSYVVFRIDRLQFPGEIAWACVDQNDESLPHPDEWIGTSPCFTLEGGSRRTRLSFVHRGLSPRLECYSTCESGWDRFLWGSLKSFVETGTGHPFDPARRRGVAALSPHQVAWDTYLPRLVVLAEGRNPGADPHA